MYWVWSMWIGCEGLCTGCKILWTGCEVLWTGWQVCALGVKYVCCVWSTYVYWMWRYVFSVDWQIFSESTATDGIRTCYRPAHPSLLRSASIFNYFMWTPFTDTYYVVVRSLLILRALYPQILKDINPNAYTGVPLPTEPAISLIILTPMKILQQNRHNTDTFLFFKFNVSWSVHLHIFQ
jgi:hypothetical protein